MNSGQEVPKALVYSTTQCALLVVGSNARCSCSDAEEGTHTFYLNSDQNAKKIHETFIKGNFIKETQAELILSSSSECNREKVLEAAKRKASEVSGEDSMFIFVYTGGVCEKSLHENTDEASQDDSLERKYSLVLNGDCKSSEDAVLGSEVGKAIQESKPQQVFLILECPHAEEIAKSTRASLSNCSCYEVAVPMGLKRAPCYIQSLHCSAFTYFLDLIMSKTEYTSGMFPLRRVLSQVQNCCEALSSLDMVQDGDWIRKNATIPKSQFMEIPEKIERNVNANKDAELASDSIGSRFASLIAKFDSWKKSFLWMFKKDPVKACGEAVDWARAITRVYLTILEDEDVLKGAVLEAAVGSIVSSIVTIQMKKEGSISDSNFFIQAYILAVAAVDFVSPNNSELRKDSLLTSSAEYYLKASSTCSPEAREPIIKLVEAFKMNC